MTQAIKISNSGEKLQFVWTNKMVDDLINNLENFKTLMELKGNYFDGERQAL